MSFIFHIGACSSTAERDLDYLERNNVKYSTDLFELATRKQIPIIYASSAATYGDGELGYSDDDELSAKLKPLNPYGDSKRQVFDYLAAVPESTLDIAQLARERCLKAKARPPSKVFSRTLAIAFGGHSARPGSAG